MVWARLDDEILDNRKMLRAGTLGFTMYAAGLIYCGRNLTDGFIPWEKVATLLDWSGVYTEAGNAHGSVAVPVEDRMMDLLGNPQPYAIAQTLTDVGLWDKAWIEAPEGDKEICIGFTVHDFLVYNPNKESVLKGRKQLTKARSEAGKQGGKQSGSKRRSKTEANTEANTQAKRSPDPDPDPNKESSVGSFAEAETKPDTKTAQLQSRESLYRKAYVAGVERGKGRAYVFPSGVRAQGDLNELLGHSGDLRGQELLDWIETTASAFARWLSIRPDEVKFYSSFDPKGCLRWKNGEHSAPRVRTMSEARPLRVVQDEPPITKEQHAAFASQLAAAVEKRSAG